MAQHADYIIANQSGPSFRADLNNALAAIVSNNSGATEPATTYAYMPWADTATGLFKIRNGANSAWITLYQLDGEWSTIVLENGTAAAPSLYFKDSFTDTGLFSAGADQVNVATAGVERVEWGASEVVFNDGGENYDFRIEGDTQSNLFLVDASEDKVKVTGGYKVINSGATPGVGPVIETENLATSLVSGDVLGQWDMISNDNSTNANGARIRIIGTVSSTDGTGRLRLQVKGTNSATFTTVFDASAAGATVPTLTAQNLTATYVNGRAVMSGYASMAPSDTQIDVDISSLFTATEAFAHYCYIEVVGIYNSGAGTINRLHKVWSQHVHWAPSAFAINGAVLENSYNSDTQNFPAGAVNASKVLTVVSGSTVQLRLQNRTGAVTGSATFYRYHVQVLQA
jgi:hypothetical protein